MRGYIWKRDSNVLGLDYYPSPANFYLLRCTNAYNIVVRLREKGILVRDCSNFNGLDRSYIRIAVRTRSGKYASAVGVCKTMKGIVIAGTHSGCGKTTVTLGLLAALAARGITVQSFKAGSDFIDAGIHRLATGRQSINLDLWMCGDEGVLNSFCRYARMGEISVIEGVMGLFDGDQGTSALACMLGLPVILVVDAYGMAESAGALVQGYSAWAASSGITLAGVIFNRVGSERHFERLKNAVQDVDVLGYLPRDADIEMPSRHLGLATAEEMPMNRRQVESLAAKIEEHVSIGPFSRSLVYRR